MINEELMIYEKDLKINGCGLQIGYRETVGHTTYSIKKPKRIIDT